MSPIGELLPTNEAQARPLTSLEPEEQSVFIRFCPGTNQKDQADCYMLPGQFWSNFGQVLVN